MPKTRELSKLIRLMGPALVIHVHKQRRVAGHRHDVRVPFHAGHERGLAHRPAQVAAASAGRDGIFADENLRTIPAVGIVAMGLADEEIGIVVIMLIHDVGHAVGRITAPDVGDELYLRILRLDRFVEKRPALVVGGAAVLIADFHVFQVERRGMAVLRAQPAPNRCWPDHWRIRWRPARPAPIGPSGPWARPRDATCRR